MARMSRAVQLLEREDYLQAVIENVKEEGSEVQLESIIA